VLAGQGWAFQGWGVSLAWWAEIVGGWGQGDEKPVVRALFGDPSTRDWPVVGGSPVPPLGLTVMRYNAGASPGTAASGGCRASFRPGAQVPTVMSGPGEPVRLAADSAQLSVLQSAYSLITGQGGQPVVQAFANSPPYWLVPGGCPQGTDGPEDLGPGGEDQYASYLAAVAAALRADGIKVTSVEPFNEPATPWPNGCSAGCQEGAGFSLAAQRRIVSGLCRALPAGVTVAAPDGNSPDDTIGAWQSYLGSMPCAGQVDTHSYQNGTAPYSGPDRPVLAGLTGQAHRTLWMSEFGSASPITIATQVADDLNQLRPATWVYWTAMEGQQGWGLLDDPLLHGTTGSTADPGIAKVTVTERYFALAQFTRYIRPGDTIVPVSASYPAGVRIVVARSAAGGLVVVAVNPDQATEPLSFDLGPLGVGTNTAATVYRTDTTDNDAELPQPAPVLGGMLTDTLPPMSVSTYAVGAPSSPPAPTQATPGHGSPEDAVDGFYQSELTGDWAAACSYVTPSAQALCRAGTSGQGAATGHVTVGTAVISGNEALVPVTGSICAPSTPCASNPNPAIGMPGSSSQFAADYQKAVVGTISGTTVISPIPCKNEGGRWYVVFG
jgi:hypothetical protein